jgi:nucleoside-diphosphate-sugar epimerase
MKTAIISGAEGFIGKHLVNHLCEHSVNIAEYDSRTDTVDSLPQADVFYHLAWEGASGVLRPCPITQAQNTLMSLQMLETAHKIGCRKFVALGTIYEKLTPQIRESHEFRTADFYLLSKDYTREMSCKLAQKLGIDLTWCTICHPIGAGIKPEQLIAYAVSGLLLGESPSFGPAEILFDIPAVEDVAAGLYCVGESGKRREYYIGSGAARPLREYLLQLPEILEVSTPVNIGVRDDDGLRFLPEWFDISPLVEDTGYSPKISFAEAVKSVACQIDGRT